MKIPSFSFLANAFGDVVKRFPFPMLAAAIGTFAGIILVSFHDDRELRDPLIKLLLTCFLGLPTLLAAAIAAEKWQLDGFKKWLPTLLALALLLLYYFTFWMQDGDPGQRQMIRFAGLLLLAHLLVAWLPYADRTPVEDFWEYNKRLLVTFLIGGFYSAIIYAGLSFAILAVDQLFNLDVNDDIYGQLFCFVAGIINTAFFLANFPRHYEGLAAEDSPYVVAVKNLSKFILIPIVGIYFLILYAYGVKILATWELPKGWVGSLVLGFSVAGMLTYLLNYLLVKFDENALVHGYRRWFFYVLVPLLALLFVGVGRRIGDYGVTESRYVLAAAGVWLLLVCVYFIVSKKDNIKFIPISLSVFALLAVLSPLDAFQVSKRSQVGRLEGLLEKHGMLADGKVTPAKDTLPAEDAEGIRSILYYLRDNAHFDAVGTWFGLPAGKKYPKWNEVDSIVNVLKVGYGTVSPSRYCSHNFLNREAVSIAGFDSLIWVDAYLPAERQADFTGAMISENRTSAEFFYAGKPLGSLDFQAFLKNLYATHDCNGETLTRKEGEVDWQGERFNGRLVLDEIAFEKEDSLVKLNRIRGVLLLKKK